MSDNVSGFIPPLSADELAAMSAPPAYPMQRDGEMVRPASVLFGRGVQHRVDLETVLAFVERTGALLPGEEPPAHVNAALRLRAWLRRQA